MWPITPKWHYIYSIYSMWFTTSRWHMICMLSLQLHQQANILILLYSPLHGDIWSVHASVVAFLYMWRWWFLLALDIYIHDSISSAAFFSFVFFCYLLFFLYNPISSLIRTNFHGLIFKFFYICTCTFSLMLRLYVTVFFYKVSFLKKRNLIQTKNIKLLMSYLPYGFLIFVMS